MPISNSYPKGVPIEDQDLFVGTKGSNNRTVNYTAQGVADYLNINSKVAIGGQMSFQFTVVPNMPKTIAFEGGLGDGTAFSAITKLVVSAIDLSTANITIFLNYLNNSQVLLSQQNQPNFFGHYKITGYTQIGTSAFYELDLEFIGGNGTIGDKQYYDLVSFVLSTEVAVPNLQEVTDVGNTTTNPIFSEDGEGNSVQVFPFGAIIISDGTNSFFQDSQTSSYNDGAFGQSISRANLTDNSNIVYPDASGTIALLSDIPVTTTPTLQSVTDVGNTTSNDIISSNINNSTIIGNGTISVVKNNYESALYIEGDQINFTTNRNNNLKGSEGVGDITLYFPTKVGDYTIATIEDIPSISGTVNYIPRFTPDGISLGDSILSQFNNKMFVGGGESATSSKGVFNIYNTVGAGTFSYLVKQGAGSSDSYYHGTKTTWTDEVGVQHVWNDGSEKTYLQFSYNGGTIVGSQNSDGSRIHLKNKGIVSQIEFYTLNTEKFRIQENGQLLINTTPSTGTTSDFILLRDTSGNIKQIAYPTIGTGSVTSVGLSMPSAFTVANSPVTSSGTLTVTGAGIASQYVRGDGTLANFPTSTGGGSSVNYYLNGSVSQGTFGGDTYYQMSKTPILGAGTNFTRTNGAGDGYIASFITDAGDPSFLNIPGGNWHLEFYFQSSASGGSPQFYGEIYKVSATNVFTLVASGSVNPEDITNGTTVDQYFTSVSVPQTSLLITDRLAIRIYVITGGRTITLHTENGNLCEVLTTFTTGLTALNGLTQQVQYFDEGTSGTDFNISSAADTHTFNLPTASATNRGALSSTDWSTFNNKQNALGFTPVQSNAAITGATKTKITYDAKGLVTAGADATTADIADSTNKRYVTDANLTTIGNQSGTNTGDETTATIKTKLGAANTSTDGYLTSANWNTFNNKLNGYLYKSSYPTATVTGTTSEVQVLQLTIPANTFSANDLLNFTSNFQKVGTTGTIGIRVKISTSATMPSGTTGQIAVVTIGTASLYSNFERTLMMLSGGNIYSITNTTSAITDTGTNTNAITSQTFDTTVTNYLYVSVTNSSSLDSTSLRGFKFSNI